MTSTSAPSSKPSPKVSRLPFVLLGLMTLFSFGGPLAFGYVLGGGASDRWPPDRPIEWATLIGISGMVVILMAACLSLALFNRKAMYRPQADRETRSVEARIVTLALVGIALVVASFVLSALLSGLARVVAPRFGLVDKPGGRKAHKAPTPMGGGVAIWLTVVLMLASGALALGPGLGFLPDVVAEYAGGAWERSRELALILGLATLIMMMGLADDRVGLGWKLRLSVQAGLAAILVASDVRLTLFWPFDSVLVSGAITVLWIVGLTNSFNFLDNMDGLAAGVGLIAASLFVAAQVEVQGRFVPAVLLVLIGALGGFLVYNKYPARLFMGDAGSNFIGFLLGTLTVVGTFTRPQEGYSPYGVLTPLLVMAVPLYDTTSVILIRLREGRSPFEADRCHFSHRLVDRGLTPPLAVRTIYLVTLAGGLGALLLPRLQKPLEAGVVVAQTVCLLGVVALLEVSSNRPERRDGQARPPH